MRLLKLRASKLFSLEEAPTEINLDHRGLVLITGMSHDEGSANGSGKSTLANKAIIWTLFGQTAGGTKGDDVINRHIGGSNCFGEIIFEDEYGSRYKVYRSRSPVSVSLFQYSAFRKEWKDISCRQSPETQALINSALGRNLGAFLQTDFFGQGRANSFLSLTNTQQVEVLERILPIENLTQWATVAKTSKKDLKLELQALNDLYMSNSGKLQEIKTVILKLRSESLRHEEATLKRKRQIRKEIEAIDLENVETQARLDQVVEELGNIAPDVDTTAQFFQDQGQKQEEQSKVDQVKRAECVEAEQDLLIQREVLQSELVEIDGKCPTCEQEISDEISRKLFVYQHELRGKLAGVDESLDIVRTHIKGWDSHLEELDNQIAYSRDRYEFFREHTLTKAQLQAEYSNLYTERQQERKNLLLDEEARLDDGNPHDLQIKSRETRLEGLKQIDKRLSEQKTELDKENEYLTFWSEIFGKDFKTYLFNKACPFLQKRTVEHLKGLGNEQIKVAFSTTKELKSGDERSGFNVDVLSESGGKGFDSLSGGEQQIVSFAVGLALADLSETQVQGSSHFLILDEPFMALDDRNCENLVNYLSHELSSKRETILLISNEENLKSLIPARIHVEKVKGITQVADD